jgi:ubiquinone/menaquinone biosynthesis C-methylase UbiE
MALPFANHSFPVVTCLEALEFLPSPKKGLAELIRVLQPASSTHPDRGWLLITNRIGWEACLMPGKTWSRAELTEILNNFPLKHINIRVWQNIYDLVWAQKVED